MPKLLIKVSEHNVGFVIYNHLFIKTDRFTIDGLQLELLEQYGLDLDKSIIQHEIDEYLNSGLVMHSLDKYKVCMQN